MEFWDGGAPSGAISFPEPSFRSASLFCTVKHDDASVFVTFYFACHCVLFCFFSPFLRWPKRANTNKKRKRKQKRAHHQTKSENANKKKNTSPKRKKKRKQKRTHHQTKKDNASKNSTTQIKKQNANKNAQRKQKRKRKEGRREEGKHLIFQIFSKTKLIAGLVRAFLVQEIRQYKPSS